VRAVVVDDHVRKGPAMGWWSKKGDDPAAKKVHPPSVRIEEDGTNVPFGPKQSRRNILAGVLLHQMMKADVSQVYGAPVSTGAADPAATVAQRVLRQDRALTGHVLREILNLTAALLASPSQPGNQRDRLDVFDEANGPVPLDAAGEIAPGSTHARFAELMMLILDFRPGVRPTGGIPAPLDRLYAPEGRAECLELLSHGTLALARCINTGRLEFVVRETFRAVTELREPGWYPSPTDVAAMSPTTLERYWDGDWSDLMRRKTSRSWEEITLPLSAVW
jgi:hypothetical protein